MDFMYVCVLLLYQCMLLDQIIINNYYICMTIEGELVLSIVEPLSSNMFFSVLKVNCLALK